MPIPYKKEPGRNGERYTPNQIIAALQGAHGNRHGAAKAIGCSWNTIYKYEKKYPEIREAREQALVDALDFVENKLFSLITKGNTAATIFYLKTQGKDRGYIERLEHQDIVDERRVYLAALNRLPEPLRSAAFEALKAELAGRPVDRAEPVQQIEAGPVS